MPAEERRPAEKAAAVISILGSERASEVFRYLTENEVEQLSMEITRLPRLAEDELEDIAKDFYNCCVTEKVITEGGRDYAKEVLEKAFGQQQARNLMDRVSKALKTKAFSFIRKVDYKTLMAAIQNEHPQTLALILSYATPEQASKIIANLSQDTRVDVVERIANMDRACHGYQDSRGGPGEENRILLIRGNHGGGRSQLHSGRDEPCGPQHGAGHIRRAEHEKSAAGRGRAQAHVCIRGHRLSGPSVRTAVPA